ncbi:shikimate kinase [Pontiellaceae bacterium B12219]|nr:shikimate kinase [Pontiellaceae bacterium B12219]
MNSKGNIVLIGMPASGKSTLGVQLAKWLSKGFMDTDLLVQARMGKSMQAYQNANGLEAYQRLECDTVNSVVCESCVIATGGSAVYCDGAMNHLKSIAHIIFLDVPLGEIKRRIGDFSQRGVVIKAGMTLDDLYAERQPLYLKYADLVVDCADKAPDDVLRVIREQL